MSTLSVTTIKSLTASTPPVIQDSAGTQIGTFCRAWVNFNGTGTVAIRAAFNVSSITDNGVGDYTINFTTAMPDANFSAAGVCGAGITENYYLYTVTYSTSSIRITAVVAATKTDVSIIGLSVFR